MEPPHSRAFSQGTMFSAAKDAMTGAAARKFINGRIERYGTVTDLKLDSKGQTMEVICELKGETAPIRVRVGRYEIDQRDGKHFIRPTSCSCNRPWIQHLLED